MVCIVSRRSSDSFIGQCRLDILTSFCRNHWWQVTFLWHAIGTLIRRFIYLGTWSHTQRVNWVYPVINENRFQYCEWAEFYKDASEAIPGNNTIYIGNCMSEHCFVDAEHFGYTDTRMSQTGIVLFYNNAPITWFRKKHNLVQSGSNITAPGCIGKYYCYK